MPLNLTKLIIDAQIYLTLHPYDLAHDIGHHYRVWEWCQKIVSAEKLSLNWEALSIATWWHDAEERKGKIVKRVKQSLSKYKLKPEFINKVISIIKEHSFGKKQTSHEAKVLFDADKLEYVSLQRLSWFIQATKDGYIKNEVARQYYHEWCERTPKIPSLLHFQFSKNEFKKYYQEAKKKLLK